MTATRSVGNPGTTAHTASTVFQGSKTFSEEKDCDTAGKKTENANSAEGARSTAPGSRASGYTEDSAKVAAAAVGLSARWQDADRTAPGATDRVVTYSSAQVSRIALVTLRQLQWWDEHNLLTPVQSAHRRVYHERDVFAALLFRELRERGFSLQVIRKVWRQMQKQGFEPSGEMARWLLTNGQRVVLLAHADVVLSFLEQRRFPAYVVISLPALAARIAAAPSPLLRRAPVMERSPRPGYIGAREAREA